jgi:hypothetical protein
MYHFSWPSLPKSFFLYAAAQGTWRAHPGKTAEELRAPTRSCNVLSLRLIGIVLAHLVVSALRVALASCLVSTLLKFRSERPSLTDYDC